MSEFAVEGTELKRMIKVARKQPVPFALNPGKTEQDTLLAMHRRKPPALLGKSAKKDGSGVKVAFGTCEVSGKVLTLNCERVVPMIAKKVKRYLKWQKVMLNVVVMDGDGNLLEQDVEDLPDDPSLYDDGDAPAPDQPAPAHPAEEKADAPDTPNAAALIARLSAIKPRIGAAPEAVAKKLTAAFQAAAGQIRAADLASADTTIGQIEAVLAKLAAAAPTPAPESTLDPLAAKWAARLDQLGPLLAALVASGHAAAGKLRKAWDMAEAAAGKADFATALQIADRVAPHLTPVKPPPQAEDTDTQKLDDLRAALGKLAQRAKPIIAGDPGRRDDILGALNLLKRAIDTGDAAQAREQLFYTAALLNAAEERQRALDALQADLPVSLALARIDWVDASDTIADQIASLRAAMLAEIEAEDIADQARKLQQLEEAIRQRGAALGGAMAKVLGADAGARAGAMDEAAKLAEDYRAFVQGSALLAHLIGHPLDQGDEPEHLSVLLKPLEKLSAGLATARQNAA